MILNLLRVEAIKVEDMIKRSFSENVTQKALPGTQIQHDETSKLLKSIKSLECDICDQDISTYYDCSSRILMIGYQLMETIIKSPVGIKAISSGRIIVVNNMVLIL